MFKPILLISTLLGLGIAQEMPPLGFDLAGSKSVSSGDTLRVKVHVPDGYHVTSNKPLSEDLIPLETSVQAAGIKFGPAIYPKPTLVAKAGLDYKLSYFEHDFVVKYPVLSVEKSLKKWPEVKVSFDFQACTEQSCFAPRTDDAVLGAAKLNAKMSAPIAVGGKADLEPTSSSSSSEQLSSSELVVSSGDSAKVAQPTQEQPVVQTQVTQSPTSPEPEQSVLKLLFFAFVGGMILNLMPCVLPVLGLKVFSLVEKKGASRSYLYANAGSFTMGTLVSFWTFAALMVILKNMGQSVGWGFQFQEPGFVIFMAVLVALFSMNLFGMFEVSLGWKAQTKMNQAGSKDGLAGAFFNGMFMTLLATPCTAPMLSPAMGYAFSQPAYVLFVFMSAVALGLAFPYVAFSLIPGALRFFPKPGDWMVTLKEFMGFLLLLTLPWLLYIFGAQAGNYSVSILFALIAVLSLMVWVYGKLPWTGVFAEHFWPKPVTILVMAMVWLGGYKFFLVPAMQEDNQKVATSVVSERWSAQEVAKLNAQGKDVFVDFTAQWCVTCKANEKVALADPRVEELFQSGRYIKLIGDYTKPSPEILAELKKFGKSGVPMYVLYRHDGTTHVFPEIITPEIVLAELSK